VHDAGSLYLPQLKDQDNVDYDNYKTRAVFYNATWRTIVGLQGMLFRKPPVTIAPPTVTTMLEDITQAGQPLQIFALEAAEELLITGRLGLFVDYPVVNTALTTKADAIAQNIRPLMKSYIAESIINWKTRQYKNKTVLCLVVLRETEALAGDDEFESVFETRYRVLDLVDIIDPVSGLTTTTYRVRIMKVEEEQGENGGVVKRDVVLDTAVPLLDGKELDFIPFYFIGVDDMSWNVDNPPLVDLVDMNLSHYRTTADYEHGCHFTGLPTPVISGYVPQDPGSKLYIGSTAAWMFPNPQAKAAYLEFTGQGLQVLENNLEKKEARMAVLGARMLEVQGKGVETADTAAIHRAGEQSMLSSMAQTISLGIEKALKVFCQFANADSTNVSFKLNDDFFPMPMDALTLTALIAGWQNSAYSYKTLHDNLKQADIVPVDADAAQELADIKANPPPTALGGNGAPTTPGNQNNGTRTEGVVKGNKPKVKKSGVGNADGTNKTITQLQNTK
jgi:hypothetical protein